MKKIQMIGTFIFVVILLSMIVSSATVVQVAQPQEAPKKEGFMSNLWSTVTSPLFIGILIFGIIIAILAVIIFFGVKWLIGFIKSQNDLFFRLKKDRIKLAKVHSRYSSKHYYKVHKNNPIRLVRKIDGKVSISNPIGYHRGDYETHEGNLIIAMNLKGNNQYFFFPITDLLIIPNKESVEISQKKHEGDKKKIKVELPNARDIVQFNENEILIYAESVSRVGLFFIPVLKDKFGKIIDLALPIFASLKEVVLGDYLYMQTDEFGKLAKESMNINPSIRSIQKVSDSNQSVEVSGDKQ